MPLPEDEESWDELDILFATTKGTVRRNKLSDFKLVNRNGKIAMKLENGDGIVGVETCSEDATVLLTSAAGQCIRFAVTDVRVFAGRNSVGVRGIKLAQGDGVISMSVLKPSDAEAWERTAYLKRSRAMAADDGEVSLEIDEEEIEEEFVLSDERFEAMARQEQMILAVSENGFGKRSSSHEYRVSGRGGKGIAAMAVTERNGPIVSTFPVEETDQIMLVTNAGKLIRCPINGIRVAGRSTQGVTIFDTADDEIVVSVERISETDDEDSENEQTGDVNGPGDGSDTTEEAPGERPADGQD